MHYRPLGNTGIQVSTISMGCNRLGEDDEDPHWDGLVGRAIELGVTLFDTSEQYTGGRSEEVLGRAVGDRPADPLYICPPCSHITFTPISIQFTCFIRS